MAGIGELVVSVTARTQKARKNIESFRSSVNRLPNAISAAARSMTGLATAAAGLVGVGAVGNEIRKSFANIDSLAKTADKLGIATEKLASLRFAAEDSGVATNTLDMALQRMVRRVAEAARGSGQAVGALAELGISAQALAAMSPDEQFKTIADAMGGVATQGEKVRLAFKLFDSGGVALVNTLKIGREGLTAYEAEAEKLGLTVSRVDAAQIEAANDAYARIGKSIEGVTNKLAVGLAPMLEKVSQQMVGMGDSGVASASNIKAGLRSVVKAAWTFADGIEFWKRAFASVRAYVTEFAAWTAKKFHELSKSIVATLNKIPGVRVEVSRLGAALVDEMGRAAKEQRKIADDVWKQPLPSAGVDAFFDDVDSKAQLSQFRLGEEMLQRERDRQAAQDAQRADQAREKMAGAANWLGGLLADIGTQATARAADGIAGVMGAFSRTVRETHWESPTILDAKSAEGFAALRANLNKDGGQNQLADAAAKAKEKADSLWAQPFPMDGINTFFGAVARRIEETRNALGDALSQQQQFIARRPGEGSPDGKSVSPQISEQARAAMNKDGLGKLLTAQQEEAKATDRVALAIAELARKFQAPETLTFG